MNLTHIPGTAFDVRVTIQNPEQLRKLQAAIAAIEKEEGEEQ